MRARGSNPSWASACPRPRNTSPELLILLNLAGLAALRCLRGGPDRLYQEWNWSRVWDEEGLYLICGVEEDRSRIFNFIY